MACWFHWVPLGALLLFDEVGVIFPKAWSQKDIDKLDFEGGVDAAKEAGRPANWLIAWQKQRHWNWDIVLTVPNIKSVRDDIRQTSEGAYKHKNRALLGSFFKGYKEGFHDAQKNGLAATDFESIKDKRITDLAFKLYNSTQTGSFTQTINGFNLFGSPRIILGLGVAFSAIFYAITSGGLSFFFDQKKPIPTPISSAQTDKKDNISSSKETVQTSVLGSKIDPQSNTKSAEMDRYENLSKIFNADNDNVATVSSNPAGRLINGPLSGAIIYISGSGRSNKGYIYTLTFVREYDSKTYLSTDIKNIGYEVKAKDHCSATIEFNKTIVPITCIFLGA